MRRKYVAAYYHGDPAQEFLTFFREGVDGVFTDFASTGFEARASYLTELPGPRTDRVLAPKPRKNAGPNVTATFPRLSQQTARVARSDTTRRDTRSALPPGEHLWYQVRITTWQH